MTALRAYTALRTADELAAQMLNVAIAWYVYAATHNPMSLAYVGLAQFLPNMAMTLFAGHVADRCDRRAVVRISAFAQMTGVAAFGWWCATGRASAAPVYLLVLALGLARALAAPAASAMLPQLVGAKDLPRAVAVSSSGFQIAGIAGPAVGGLLYAFSAPALFAAVAGLYGFALLCTRGLKTAMPSAATKGNALAGIRYVRSNRLLLSLISLDLFAVLLGGVTALLPIYASDILHTGPAGLGWLRCAPGAGAALVGLLLTRRAAARGAGRRMLACVAGFGLATIGFAISTNFWLSFVALLAAGGFDMVSMVIRQTLIQTATPDAMRGRVSAVSWIFIGASSELGEFESGVTAAWFGAMPAALLGGLGTLAVVALWAAIFPELRNCDTVGDESSHACRSQAASANQAA